MRGPLPTHWRGEDTLGNQCIVPHLSFTGWLILCRLLDQLVNAMRSDTISSKQRLGNITHPKLLSFWMRQLVTDIQANNQKLGLWREIVHISMTSLFGEQGMYLLQSHTTLSESSTDIPFFLQSSWVVFYILIYLPDPGLVRSLGNTSKFFWIAWTHTLSLTQSWWWTMIVPTISKACMRWLKSSELRDF